MLGISLAELRQRAEGLAVRLRQVGELAKVKVSEDVAFVGGGSLPDQSMKTYVLEIEAQGLSDEELAYRLRTGTPAVIGRLRDGKLVLDVRTVFSHQEDGLIEAVRNALHDQSAEE
jgi:L-seryl-tRNA(Ser) seleniumtransferase